MLFFLKILFKIRNFISGEYDGVKMDISGLISCLLEVMGFRFGLLFFPLHFVKQNLSRILYDS